DAELDGGSFSTWRGRLSARGGSHGLGVAASATANGTDNQRHPNDWKQKTQLVRVDYRMGPALESGATFRGMQSDYTSPGDIRSSNTTPAGTTTLHHYLGTLWIQAEPLARWRSKLVLGLGSQNSEAT